MAVYDNFFDNFMQIVGMVAGAAIFVALIMCIVLPLGTFWDQAHGKRDDEEA